MNWPTKCPMSRRYLPFVARILVLPTIFTFVSVAHAQTGSMGASLNPCIIAGGGSTCTSTISWTSSGTSAVQVWVSDNGGTAVLFASSGVGGPYTSDATWILPAPHSYVFTLYDYSSGTRGATLGSKTVTGKYSIVLTWGNTTNSDISPNFVVGDYWTLNITGAPAGASIVWAFIKLPGSLIQYYTLGSTNSSGGYNQSAQETVGSLGIYGGQWQVGGQNINNEYDFEVVRRPNNLKVDSTVASNCPDSSHPYGVSGAIKYTIWDSNDYNLLSYNLVMYPYYTVDGGGLVQIGSASSGTTDGWFNYNPIYLCGTGTFGATAFGDEIIYIRIGGSAVYESVRSQSWTGWGYAYHSGRVTNGTDVDISQ